MSEHGPARQFGRSVLRLVMAVVAITVIGLGAGYLFGRTDSRRAADLLVDDFVVDEPIGTVTEPPAPSSGGEGDGTARCGAQTQTLSPADQIAAIRAGVVVVQYRDTSSSQPLRTWASGRDGVVVAPNDAIDEAVVATAWGRRMRLNDANQQLLTAFAVAYGGAGPDEAACGA